MTSNSISVKIIRRLSLVISVTSLGILALLFVYLRHELYEQFDRALKDKAKLITAVLESTQSPDEKQIMLTRALPGLGAGRRHPDFFEAWELGGETVIRSPSLVETDEHLALFSPNEDRFRILNMRAPNGAIGRALSSPTRQPGATRHEAYSYQYSFVFISNTAELYDAIQTTGFTLLLIGGGLTAAVVWVATSLVRRELQELRDFSDEVATLNENNLSKRFVADQFTEELQPIALRLNALLERLEQAFARERRFTGNVAHELRTPLAELRCMIEVARKWPLEGNELDRHHENELSVVRRMSAVVENLIRLVRTQGLRSSLKLQGVDLPASLHAAWAPYEQRARQRGVSIAFNMPHQIQVRTEPVMLASLLDNLFNNASTYSTAGSQIECTVDSIDPASIRIQVVNETFDMTQSDLQHLEEPFWRKDASRTATDHAGLGLALVAEYAKLLNLSCNYQLRGNQFVVEITGFCQVSRSQSVEPAQDEFLPVSS